MRRTLRRSCAACAKFKHSCDLRTPSCSRCVKRKVLCVYANQPLTATLPSSGQKVGQSTELLEDPHSLIHDVFGSLDPFESYPPTRLPRQHVQRLIYSFLHKIAFQYYPLDLSPTSNPFLISWWPLALGDPALFHVSLQTACLDEELLAQKGFQTSDILMADSVALLRRKVEVPYLAVQDGTMNSVITLATIEFGKGNIEISKMHVDGVKRMIDLRGGINAVRQTSPLTARMVAWVSMLIMGYPQFNTQDDVGTGNGIPPIPEWQSEPTIKQNGFSDLAPDGLNDEVQNVYMRLCNVFQRAQQTNLSTTQLHDLACFVIHRLLLPPSRAVETDVLPFNECFRCAMILYMFVIQGPTYYSHAMILETVVARLMDHLQQLPPICRGHTSVDVWLLGVGMVASVGTAHYQWYIERSRSLASSFPLATSEEAVLHMKNILWLDSAQAGPLIRRHWDAIVP